MDYATFRRRLIDAVPPGTALKNPGRGITDIVSYTSGDNLAYRRGKSTIYVSIRALYAAYKAFRGQTVSSTDLRDFAPGVFNSKRGGHSCNCTVLFMVLRAMGLVERIEGAGKRGNPYWVRLKGTGVA